jgi:Beta-amyloid precursor protein C-terminus
MKAREVFSTTFCYFLSSFPLPQSFSVRRQIYGASGREGRNVYFTLAFAGVALMAAVFVGVAVAKYRASRSPHAQGFVEVDQVSLLKLF